MIYACQDREFDSSHGLHSIPSRLGVARALLLSRLFHIIAVVLLVAVGSLAEQGVVYGLGVLTIVVLLVYEHSIVTPRDLSRVNVAFFTLNGLVSLAFMTAVVVQAVI